ncbi:MAG: hypothetical protein ACTH3S_15205 [Marinobacter sp.]|uniref:hypothetical protein n=1 Tax=Marinobacter sp. TaxID=50741 RepID=UPI003F9E55A7
MLGALVGLAMIVTFWLVVEIDPAVSRLASMSSADLKSIDDLGCLWEVSRRGKFGNSIEKALRLIAVMGSLCSRTFWTTPAL